VQDTTAPAITVPADITAEATSPAGAVVTYTASATDAVGTTSFGCVPASGSTFGLGTTTVDCNASDEAGNTSSKSFHVTVQDTTAPVIATQADITAEATSASGASVGYSTPTATDAVDGTDTVNCLPTSGSTFALGSTTVNCSSTDAAGNTGHSSFHVVVQDTTPPAIAAHGDVGPVEATGPLTTVAYTVPTATDAVDGTDSVSCSPAPGTGFPVGSTTINCMSTDTHGNTSHSSFHVIVQDTTAPSITVPSDITKEATGPMTPVTYTATATDAVGTTSFSCVPPSGSSFPLGTTMVTCNASDAAGNSSSKSFHVTIQDTTGPAMTGVPSNMTVTTGNASGTTVTFTTPTANDLVDGPEPVTCTPPSGSNFPPGTTTVHCDASDSSGNTTDTTFTVTVNVSTESTPPVISGLPGNTSQEATGPYGVHFTFNITVKDPDDAGTFQCTGGPVANYAFPVVNMNNYSYTVTAPVGVDTITCNATDSHGNNAVPKSFVLTVTDHTPPVFGPAPNITVNATSAQGAVVNYTKPTATDLVDGSVPVTCTPASGSLFHNGGTQVHCTATDSHGNTATKNFNVTVLSANDQLNALKQAVDHAPELRGGSNKHLRDTLMNDLNQVGNPTDPHNKYVALTWLNAFKDDVTANTPPILSADNTAWIGAANALRTVVISEANSLNDELHALKAGVDHSRELAGPSGQTVRNTLDTELNQAGDLTQAANHGNACSKLAAFISSVQGNTPPISSSDSADWVGGPTLGATGLRASLGC
jgi:hypothetical protein